MKYFKAFNKGMTCRGKQYEEGKEYEENGGDICGAGMMHFCETPFDTLDYYPLIDSNGNFSEFAEVEPLAEIVKDSNKFASKKIKIGAKLSFKDFIKAGVEVLIEKTKFEKPTESDLTDKGENFVQIGSSGNGAQIGSSGYGAKIGSSGNGAQIGSSGYQTTTVAQNLAQWPYERSKLTYKLVNKDLVAISTDVSQWKKLIEETLTNKLTAKGLTKTDSNANLTISYGVVTKSESNDKADLMFAGAWLHHNFYTSVILIVGLFFIFLLGRMFLSFFESSIY